MSIMGYLVAIIFLVIIGNFFLLYKRFKRDRKPVVKPVDRQIAYEARHEEIQRIFDREQEEAERYIELRNKTFELYDQVRRNAAAGDRGAAPGAPGEAAVGAAETAPEI